MQKYMLLGGMAAVIGLIWLASSFQGLDLQGIRAIAIPLLLSLFGLKYLVKGLRGER